MKDGVCKDSRMCDKDNMSKNYTIKRKGHGQMMTKMNSASRLLALLLTALLLVSFAACGMTSGEKSMEPKNAEEAAAMHKELMAQEKAILSENTALWEKGFMAADKGMTMQEDGKNYGEFLLDTIESAKDQFSADELKLLKGEAEKICDIESKLTMLEKKYPEAAQKSLDGDMNRPADGDMKKPADGDMKKPADGDMQKFPSLKARIWMGTM